MGMGGWPDSATGFPAHLLNQSLSGALNQLGFSREMEPIETYINKGVDDSRRWIWANFRRWWKAKPGALQSTWSRRVRHNLFTEHSLSTVLCSSEKILVKYKAFCKPKVFILHTYSYSSLTTSYPPREGLNPPLIYSLSCILTEGQGIHWARGFEDKKA